MLRFSTFSTHLCESIIVNASSLYFFHVPIINFPVLQIVTTWEYFILLVVNVINKLFILKKTFSSTSNDLLSMSYGNVHWFSLHLIKVQNIFGGFSFWTIFRKLLVTVFSGVSKVLIENMTVINIVKTDRNFLMKSYRLTFITTIHVHTCCDKNLVLAASMAWTQVCMYLISKCYATDFYKDKYYFSSSCSI